MGLFGFGGTRCCNCGEKAGMSGRVKLLDDQYVCSTCMLRVPYYMEDVVKETYTTTDIRALSKYYEYSRDNYRTLFHETHRYGPVGLDAEHGLFYLGYEVNRGTMFLQCSEVDSFDLIFDPEDLHDGLFSTSVTGRIILGLKMETPEFEYEEVLERNIKVPAKKTRFGAKVEYEAPEDMLEFEITFLEAINKALEAELDDAYREAYGEEYGEEYTEHLDEATTMLELQQAMTLFMFDDLDDITVEKVKAQRNRLIKAFHPDKGTAEDTNYAQKINHAYDTILKYLRER